MLGISMATIDDFCAAIELVSQEDAPRRAANDRLASALRQLCSEAHAAGLTAERLLIGLKEVWIVACRRATMPDIFDPLWRRVVRTTLDSFEATRPA
jgi:hypothetical protein